MKAAFAFLGKMAVSILIAGLLAGVGWLAVTQPNPPPVATQANRDCYGHGGVWRIYDAADTSVVVCRDGHAGSIDQ